MRGPVTSDVVKDIARLAGFDFGEKRCEHLAGELTWLLGEADRIDELGLSAEEAVLTFDPERYVSDSEKAG